MLEETAGTSLFMEKKREC